MAYEIMKEDVWIGEVADKPGGLADKLEPMAKGGVDLGFMVARRDHENPGRTVVFVTSLGGPDAIKTVEKQGFKKWTAPSLRIEGRDRPGLGADIARAVGKAGINMRGLSGARLGGRAVIQIAFEKPTDADQARTALNKALNG